MRTNNSNSKLWGSLSVAFEDTSRSGYGAASLVEYLPTLYQLYVGALLWLRGTYKNEEKLIYPQ